MVRIRNGGDLRVAYEVLADIQTLKPLSGRETAVCGHIWQLKKDIREYLREQEQAVERHIIRDDGSNGYMELIKLPKSLLTKEDAAAYFEERELLQGPNSLGGCIGRAFTCWYGIICRQEKMWAYHRVS